MPADLVGSTTFVLRTNRALDREEQQLLNELAWQLTQKAIDGQLAYPIMAIELELLKGWQ